PLLLRSPLLTDEDILSMIARTSDAHHEAVAARPHIGEPVTDVLARSNAEPVLVALVRNITAKISGPAYETLVEKSRKLASLQEPLSSRTDLPPALAKRMCEWVSDSLKAYILKNYDVAPIRLAAALNQAEAFVGKPPPAPAAVPAASSQKLI